MNSLGLLFIIPKSMLSSPWLYDIHSYTPPTLDRLSKNREEEEEEENEQH